MQFAICKTYTIIMQLLGARPALHRTSAYVTKSAFLEGGGSLSANISQERGRRPQTTLGVRKLDWLLFHFLVLSPYMHLTDGRTDRQNELSQRLVRYCSVEDATLEEAVCCR